MGFATNDTDVRIGSRDAERVRVLSTIDLRSARANCLVVIHDLSATGARIETQSVCLEPGDVVQLRLPFLPAEQRGEIAWVIDSGAGVRFSFPLKHETFDFLARAMKITETVGALWVGQSVKVEPEPAEAERCTERADVAIGASCRTEFGGRGSVAMIDLTPQGCCLFARDFNFVPSQRITLQAEGLAAMKATVQWSKGPLTGVLFDKPLYHAVFSHLATAYPWPLTEQIKESFGPRGHISEAAQRELRLMMDRAEKDFHGRNDSRDVLTTRPPILGTRPGIAPQATDGKLARLFLG